MSVRRKRCPFGTDGAFPSGVKSIQFRLDRRLGAKAAFVRNDRLLMLNPVEGVICEGSGIQMNLAQKLRRAGVPLHVDGCLGGFILPFGQELGFPNIPLFD